MFNIDEVCILLRSSDFFMDGKLTAFRREVVSIVTSRGKMCHNFTTSVRCVPVHRELQEQSVLEVGDEEKSSSKFGAKGLVERA